MVRVARDGAYSGTVCCASPDSAISCWYSLKRLRGIIDSSNGSSSVPATTFMFPFSPTTTRVLPHEKSSMCQKE